MDLKSIIRRPAVWGTLISIAVMAIVAIAFFYPDNFDGNVLSQEDVRQGIANGEEARAFQEATGETTRWTNSLFSGMPTFQISPSYPSDGLFKWVNGVYSLGLPGCSGLVMMMMLGMYIMLMAMGMRWYYSLIGALAWGFSSYYIIIIGAGHLWKFYTLTYVPPTLGGVIIAYRGRILSGAALGAFGLMMQISWNHIQMTYYFMFVVGLIALSYLVYAIRHKDLMTWGKATGTLLIAAALAVGANAPNIYFTSRYAPESIRGGHSELTSEGETTTSKGLDKDYITQYSYGKMETLTLAIPNVKGGASALPSGGHLQYASLADLPDAPEAIKAARLDGNERMLLSAYSQYFGEPESTNGPVYVGVIICALFLLGCIIVKGPVKWALLLATILSIALAWGRNFMPLTDFFIDLVPGYNKFRTPESILVIAQFAMPALGVMALCQLLTEPLTRRTKRAFYISFGLIGAICLIGWLKPSTFGSTDYEGDLNTLNSYMMSAIQAGQPADQIQQIFARAYNNIAPVAADLRHGLVTADSLRSLIYLLLAGGALLWGIRKGRTAYAVGAVGLLVIADLYGVDKRYLNHESFNRPIRQVITADAADRAILADTAMNYRVMPMGGAIQMPDRSYFHKSVGGYHAAKLARYNDLLQGYLYADAVRTDGSVSPVSDMLNVKYLIYGPDQVIVNSDAMGNAWFVDKVEFVDTPDDEFAALGVIDPAVEAVADSRFSDLLGGKASPKVPGDTIYETSYAPNRLTYNVKSARGGVAVFSEIYFPWGWEATVDGTPVEIGRVNYVLRALPIEPGEHRVEMTFKPAAVKTTCTVATISAILIYLMVGGAIAMAVRRRKEAEKA
ncbi:MAG: YfhO family protein [Bacteroidales bacterium]|nr:YfhO family protein [Bacteroidales bacterium]